MSGIVIIANPGARGGRNLADLEHRVEDDPRLVLHRTTVSGDARRLAREGAEGGADVVVAAGGDGTIHEVVAGLVAARREVPLGVIPNGTGNDLARSLSIPMELDDALAVVESGHDRAIDLLRMEMDGIEGDPCVNAASGGFTGRVHDALDDEIKERWGPLSYLRSAVEALGDLERWQVRLTIGGRERSVSALNVVVANGRFAGRGIPIAPHADLFDGLLDVAVVADASMVQLSRLAPAILRGEPPEDDEHFFTEQAREVSLEADRPMPFSLDGERIELRTARFSVLGGALRVRMP